MKSEQVLPCPFCGKPPNIFPSGDGTGTMIQCETKGCVNPHVSYYGNGVAVKVWNKRLFSAKMKAQENNDHCAENVSLRAELDNLSDHTKYTEEENASLRQRLEGVENLFTTEQQRVAMLKKLVQRWMEYSCADYPLTREECEAEGETFAALYFDTEALLKDRQT